MILDKLSNSPIYANLGQRFKEAFEWLGNTDLLDLPQGRTEINGDQIYAVNLTYQTQAVKDCSVEAHRRYADVQFMLKGKEWVGYAHLKGQTPKKEYDQEADYAFYESDLSFFVLEENSFAIFFPEDLHMPGVLLGSPQEVRKVVVKVLLD